jgi:DNA-binding GntR family transcriptional regulator
LKKINEDENIINNKDHSLIVISTVDTLVDAIQKEIFNGVWKPGEKIRESELINMYGISRHSLREALVALTEQGLLERRMNRGVFMRQFSKEEIEDLYFTRLILEIEATKNLARKKIIPDEIGEALENFKKQKQSDPWSNIIKNDVKFHKALVDSLGSYRTSKLFESLLIEFELINRKPKSSVLEENIYIRHHKIVEAIKKGNEEKAIFLLTEHLRESAQFQIKERFQTR